MISIIMKTLLYSSPKMNFSKSEISEYNELITGIYQGQLDVSRLTFPKCRFLHYLALEGNFLFHGSNNVNIDTLEKREQTLFNGELTKAVFASSEAIWSMFYAVFDRDKLIGGFRNGCLIYRDKKYHYYSLNTSTINNNPWTSGKVYILPKDKFKHSDSAKLRYDEWICQDSVSPLTGLEISANDFPFINKVSTHKNHESNIKTMLLYKIRTLRVK